ncbi:hypothetical protein HBI56_176060 [Parastagonospora nodorum]|uniref:Uncharacterized protein n=2 Tax=Phaeosphaeria nodorum (strain SN15 / ATCC MYA-4574 / FGSC 10173) TaxID=321614 RepID=A0A7U2FEP4_PHANO|nr:hypothetical protein SNOG_13745 [Parastagonospora nodorum SN15]KAH3904209.1 hypothetical protein HBH56_237200 [Parastagonospora nodorum]EAT78769.2 hypothetical protein SNOG_13745 [Parastagonospora nodorum SN15]KAH3924339.1 hypothetical protein HBH54_197420 [Parastagonospora nodorum]KAH3942516.1 hypothetical protein HBH53_186050 [Parastagonospora nodorum]KAH3961661.1 hypothetical protein HBH51_181300 [Parastagonospora nodorum]
MCRQITVSYTCPEPCGYTQSAWETHCQYTGRDNLQGGCGRADNAGMRQVNYPCPHHRGLNFDFIAGNVIGQTGRDLGRPTWQNFPDSCAVHRAVLGAAQARQRDRWVENPDLFEREPGMPEKISAACQTINGVRTSNRFTIQVQV